MEREGVGVEREESRSGGSRGWRGRGVGVERKGSRGGEGGE